MFGPAREWQGRRPRQTELEVGMEDMFEDLKTRRTAKQELADKEAAAGQDEQVEEQPRVFTDPTETTETDPAARP